MHEPKGTRNHESDSPQRSAADRKRSPSGVSYSLTTWTGAAYADNRILYVTIGAATVLFGSIGAALWFCR
jgi:hypothetical protein